MFYKEGNSHIYFEKQVASEIQNKIDENTFVIKGSYEFIETPQVYDLNDLVGTDEL